MASVIDLNADLGETVDGMPTGDDEAIFPLVTSANIACGGHAGDAASMTEAVARAARFGVAIGAHPAYPDRAGFGRTRMTISAGDLCETLTAQMSALADAGADIRYVKPHGALYNVAVHDAEHAEAVVLATLATAERIGKPLAILGLGGHISRLSELHGIRFVREAFLDRGYEDDGTLVSRAEPGAVLHDPQVVADRAVRFVRDGVVTTRSGIDIPVHAESLCVHGDTPEAVTMARAVRSALTAAHIAVRAAW